MTDALAQNCGGGKGILNGNAQRTGSRSGRESRANDSPALTTRASEVPAQCLTILPAVVRNHRIAAANPGKGEPA